MKIIINVENPIAALRLRNKIIKSVKGEILGVNIETWSYTNANGGYDILYHNPEQYVNAPEKNVVFRMQIDGSTIMFSTAWWRNNPEPDHEYLCLHTGRLTEMLLRYFANSFVRFSITE